MIAWDKGPLGSGEGGDKLQEGEGAEMQCKDCLSLQIRSLRQYEKSAWVGVVTQEHFVSFSRLIFPME